jgi:hypothetical protein
VFAASIIRAITIAYDSFKREVLFNILIKFRKPMKLIWLIKFCVDETYSKVYIGKHFSSKWSYTKRYFITIAFQSLEYMIRNAQKYKDGLELNGAHQFLVFADDVNLLCENISTITKHTKALRGAIVRKMV